MRTAEQYFASLRDGRRVFYRGAPVPDVTAHPVIGLATRHAAVDYEMAEDPEHRNLAVVDGTSRYFVPPRSTDDLLARSRLIETATRLGGTLVVLIKEIGTDALFGLSIVAQQVGARAGTQYGERVRALHRHCA